MNNVNKTLYIPLYGKAFVSKKGIILSDRKAEEIWEKEGFALKGKSKSKWLAYYMGMRSAVFDEWAAEQMDMWKDAVVIHLGCGLDSRVLRVGTKGHKWYDVDFEDVIQERKRYYRESKDYQMISGDVRESAWLNSIPKTATAIVVMEGISMYMNTSELTTLTSLLCNHFGQVNLLMDCYTTLAAKMSKYKNPINDVGVHTVYGLDEPEVLNTDRLQFVLEHDMTPQKFMDELDGIEKVIFEKMYAGKVSKKMYRLYEFKGE